jgi:hypothetical protein
LWWSRLVVGDAPLPSTAGKLKAKHQFDVNVAEAPITSNPNKVPKYLAVSW